MFQEIHELPLEVTWDLSLFEIEAYGPLKSKWK